MVLLESQIKLNVGDIAPDFTLLGVDDKKHSLDQYAKYRGVLIIFMCNHCPYVKAKIDAIKEIDEKFKDIAVIGINSNDPITYPEDNFENMKKTVNDNKIMFDYLMDETQEIAKKYGAMCTPDPFLFNANKELVYHGKIDDASNPDAKVSEKTMINNITKLLDKIPIEKGFDPSIGCSIKWKETR